MATREEYDKIKERYKDESLCPFCPGNRAENEILRKGKYWTIFRNKYPYLGLEKHLLAIPNRHIEFTAEIEREEWTEMKDIEVWMRSFYGDVPYFSFIRQIGKTKSIKHLHYHYLPGEVTVEPIENMLRLQNM